MKALKLSLILAVAALVTFGLSGAAFAFHSGGVAECEGCHTMHNSLNGGVMVSEENPDNPNPGQVGAAPGSPLLQASDQSSVCLNCHYHPTDTSPSSYHIMGPLTGTPVERTPGGDFAWLKKDYSWIPRGTDPASTEYSYGYQHGHNVISADYGLDQDTSKAGNVSPGGTYPTGSFYCISCHDPHGKYRRTDASATFSTTGAPIKTSGSYGTDGTTGLAVGAFRLLGGVNYMPVSIGAVPAFSQNPMIAYAPSSYNRSEASSDTAIRYGRGVSEWCANCHAKMHSSDIINPVVGVNVHPTSENLGALASNYNSYVKTGDMSGTGNGFWSLVPVQTDSVTSNAALKTASTDTTTPVSATDKVMCLSCHRAHASGFDSMLRFPIGNEFMTVADGSGNPVYPDPAVNPAQAMGRSQADFQAALYDRPATKFAPFQRALCNKCHAKD